MRKVDKVIQIKEEVRLPGTNIILEPGDTIEVLDEAMGYKPYDYEKLKPVFNIIASHFGWNLDVDSDRIESMYSGLSHLYQRTVLGTSIFRILVMIPDEHFDDFTEFVKRELKTIRKRADLDKKIAAVDKLSEALAEPDVRYEVTPQDLKDKHGDGVEAWFDLIALIYDREVKYAGDVLEITYQGKSLFRAKRKYTYATKNVVRTNYLYISNVKGMTWHQTKDGWKQV